MCKTYSDPEGSEVKTRKWATLELALVSVDYGERVVVCWGCALINCHLSKIAGPAYNFNYWFFSSRILLLCCSLLKRL